MFFIAAPLMATSLKLDLPKTTGGSPSEAREALLLAVDADGQLHLGDEKTTPQALSERVRAAARRDRQTEVHLRADSRVPYGRVAELIGLIQDGGLSRIGFVTDPGAAAAPAPPTPPK